MSRETNAWIAATSTGRQRALRRRWGPLALSACLILAAAAGARASDDPQGQSGGPAAAQQGPLVLERTTHGSAGGIVVAPELKITNIDHDLESFLGAYVGWRFGNGFLVGGGIYGELDWYNGHYHDGHWYSEPDTTDQRHMTYGGGVIGWSMPGNSPVRFGVRALVGGGWTRRYDYGYDPWNGNKPGHPPDPYYYYDDWQHFFVLEPQADLSIRLSRHLSLGLSGGYRAVADSEGTRPELGGAVGSLSLQIGRF